MASILKRGEYSFQAVIRRRGFPSQTKTFETKTDAQRWARMVEREMDQGAWRDSSLAERTSLGDILRRYMAEVTPAKKGAEIEVIKIKALLRDQICPKKLSQLSSMDLANWRDRRLQTVKGSTVNREFAIISHAIEIARKEWGIHIENPAHRVRRAPGSAARTRRLGKDEEIYLSRSLERTRNKYVAPMAYFAIETAMRRSELLALRWENVSLDRRTAFLPKTKNGDSRVVPLSSKAIEILKSLSSHSVEQVFPLSMDSFKQAFERSVERARNMYLNDCIQQNINKDDKSLVDLHFHDLRHEATSRLFELGLNVMEVASITGHKTLQMLHRYTHLRAEDLVRKLK